MEDFKMKTYLFYTALFVSTLAALGQARELKCELNRKDAKAADVKGARTVLHLSDDQGSITQGAFEGLFRDCRLNDQAENYHYYYGEFVKVEADCQGSSLLLHANNQSSRSAEKSSFHGRAVRTLKQDKSEQVYRVHCRE